LASADLERYIKLRLDRIEDSIPGARQSLETELLSLANGSFLWVRLVIDLLQRNAPISSEKELFDLIQSFPLELHNAYDYTFESFRGRSSTHEWNTLLEVLSILLVIVKPLTLESLIEALNTPTSHTATKQVKDSATISETYTIGSLRYRIIDCFDLLQIDSSGVLCFVHATVEEYLRSSDIIQSSNRAMSPVIEAHLKMADKCVTKIRLAFSSEPRSDLATSTKGAFTEYAASNWMRHFFESQDFAHDLLKSSVYELFGAPDGPSSLTQWLTLYETSGEVLPRQKIFGPLFGAAYFGLRPIVQMALEIGADIEAQDEKGKTALHWASERGHVHVVDMLLAHGANLENRTYAGWSPLHFAAQQGHQEIIRILLLNGANVNSEAADGRSPLQGAIEAARVEVVAHLLNADANPTQSSYDGPRILQLAQTKNEIFNTLMESSPALRTLLHRSIFDNDSDTLSLLFQRRSDIIIQEYPWIGDLLEENIPQKEILDLLLKSENLNWVYNEEFLVRNKESWKHISRFEHHRRCAHNLKSLRVSQDEEPVWPERRGGPTTQQDNSGEGAELQGLKHGETQLRDSSETDSSQSTSMALDPEKRIEELETREQGLISVVGVGGVFPPEQCKNNQMLNPGFAQMRRHVAHILYGDQPVSIPSDFC